MSKGKQNFFVSIQVSCSPVLYIYFCNPVKDWRGSRARRMFRRLVPGSSVFWCGRCKEFRQSYLLCFLYSVFLRSICDAKELANLKKLLFYLILSAAFFACLVITVYTPDAFICSKWFFSWTLRNRRLRMNHFVMDFVGGSQIAIFKPADDTRCIRPTACGKKTLSGSALEKTSELCVNFTISTKKCEVWRLTLRADRICESTSWTCSSLSFEHYVKWYTQPRAF